LAPKRVGLREKTHQRGGRRADKKGINDPTQKKVAGGIA